MQPVSMRLVLTGGARWLLRYLVFNFLFKERTMRDPLTLVTWLLEKVLAVLLAFPRKHGWLIGGLEVFLLSVVACLVVWYFVR